MVSCSAASKSTVESHRAGPTTTNVGQVATAPLISLTNSRRLIATPKLRQEHRTAQSHGNEIGARAEPISRSSGNEAQLTESHTLPVAALPQALTKIAAPGRSMMLKEKICSLLVWTPCEAPSTINSISGKLE